MKEKIGIEKLIELLNEYREKELGYRVPEWEEKGQLGISKELLISKKFGFIKWLVDNDKIDLDKLEKKVLKENLIRKFDEGLLMLLSISSSPIDDLISYLK